MLGQAWLSATKKHFTSRGELSIFARVQDYNSQKPLLIRYGGVQMTSLHIRWSPEYVALSHFGFKHDLTDEYAEYCTRDGGLA